MSARDGESLHGGELLRTRRVRDVHRADRVVRRDHLLENKDQIKGSKDPDP